MSVVSDWIMAGLGVAFVGCLLYLAVAVWRELRAARAFDALVRARSHNPTPEEHAAWKARAWAESRVGQNN